MILVSDLLYRNKWNMQRDLKHSFKNIRFYIFFPLLKHSTCHYCNALIYFNTIYFMSDYLNNHPLSHKNKLAPSPGDVKLSLGKFPILWKSLVKFSIQCIPINKLCKYIRYPRYKSPYCCINNEKKIRFPTENIIAQDYFSGSQLSLTLTFH